MIAGLAAGCVLVCVGYGFHVEPLRALGPLIGSALLLGARTHGKARGDRRLVAGATAFLQMTLFTVLGVVLAYGFAARAPRLWDTELAWLDAALGFDWERIFRGVDRHPLAVWIGGFAYHSLVAQMIGCILVLSATHRFEALRRAVAAAILSGMLTILVSAFMPAMGNVFDPADYRYLWPSVAWTDRDLIAGLRDGGERVLDLGQMTGIVTFPSYHATLTVVLAHAVRGVPVLRVAAPILAGLTVVSTPLFGGHYAMDVLAGLVLAAGAIALAPWLTSSRSLPTRSADRPSLTDHRWASAPAPPRSNRPRP
jgi:membrane-associated phospholipid phosphatase